MDNQYAIFNSKSQQYYCNCVSALGWRWVRDVKLAVVNDEKTMMGIAYRLVSQDFASIENMQLIRVDPQTGNKSPELAFPDGKPIFAIPKVEPLPSYPQNCNPFHHEPILMGTQLVRGWVAMHEGYDRPEEPQPLNFVILVNTRTGQRFKVTLT